MGPERDCAGGRVLGHVGWCVVGVNEERAKVVALPGERGWSVAAGWYMMGRLGKSGLRTGRAAGRGRGLLDDDFGENGWAGVVGDWWNRG